MRTLIVFTALIAAAFSASLKPRRFPLPLEKQRGIGRIVGGTNAADGEFPFQVSMRSVGLFGLTHFCGGSILNENYIISAAHCCVGQSPASVHIVAGGTKLYTNEGPEQRVDAKRIIPHESYSSSGYVNDICLIELKEPLVLGDGHVDKVKLPAAGLQTPAGTDAIVTGWGATFEGGFLATNLKKVTVPVVSDADCNKAYSDVGVADSMICAGFDEGGKDSCQGDSGGPFINAETRELLGVVSWGYGCARPGYPGVYSEVSYFIDWLNDNAV